MQAGAAGLKKQGTSKAVALKKSRTKRGHRYLSAIMKEAILMRYFFPDIKDRRRLQREKDAFARDM